MKYRHLKTLTAAADKGFKRGFHQSATSYDAVHYIQAFPDLFSGTEHGDLIRKHSNYFHDMNHINKKYFGTTKSNTEIRAIYNGTSGLEDDLGHQTAYFQELHMEFSKEYKTLSQEYKQQVAKETQNQDTKVVDYLTREFVKYGARGQMVIKDEHETLDLIHISSTEKYGNPVGPNLSDLTKANKDIEASSSRKRPANQLKEDLRKIKSEMQSKQEDQESIEAQSPSNKL